MPLETVRNQIHIRRKKNDVVFQNIARLWQLHETAISQQDILDGLHPWAGPIQLKFDNQLPYVLAGLGLFLCSSLIIDASNVYVQITFAVGLAMSFWAWLSYETDKPIQEVIQALENKVISFKYGLHYFAMPPHLSLPINAQMLPVKLKQLFPLFNLGSIANDFPVYASTFWEDDHGQQHSVLIFQYRYVTEITLRDKNGDKVRVKEVEQYLYGTFVFESQKFQGLAFSSQKRNFASPYQTTWKTSDILLNQKLNIFGVNQITLAKQMTPANVLKFDQFFQHQDGSLIFHPEQHCLCFLGKKNLFQASAKKQEIYDISALRGYLRTFRLPYLEQLKTDLTTLLKN